MPKKTEWHPRTLCPKCGWHIYAPFASAFHVHIACCPKCGREKYDGFRLAGLYRTATEWKVKTMRWVSTSKLMKPSTWDTGHWETLSPLESQEGDTLSKESR